MLLEKTKHFPHHKFLLDTMGQKGKKRDNSVKNWQSGHLNRLKPNRIGLSCLIIFIPIWSLHAVLNYSNNLTSDLHPDSILYLLYSTESQNVYGVIENYIIALCHITNIVTEFFCFTFYFLTLFLSVLFIVPHMYWKLSSLLSTRVSRSRRELI